MANFELNSLDNIKDISFNVLFRTFQLNFQHISVTRCDMITTFQYRQQDKKNIKT